MIGPRPPSALRQILDDNPEVLDDWSSAVRGIAVFEPDLTLRHANDAWRSYAARYGAAPSSQAPREPGLFDYFPGIRQRIEPSVMRALEGHSPRCPALSHTDRRGGQVSGWNLRFTPLRQHGQIIGVVQVVAEVADPACERAGADQRGALMQLVAQANRRLLEADLPWAVVVDDVLNDLGTAMRASRVALHEHILGAHDGQAGVVRAAWMPHDPQKSASERGQTETLHGRLAAQLSAATVPTAASAQVIVLSMPDAPNSTRPLLEALGIRSLAVAAIVVDGREWGALVVEDHQTTRSWSVIEREALSVVATSLSAAVSRQLAQHQAGRNEHRIRSIMANASDITIVIDREGILTFAAPSVERLIGGSPENACGRHVLDPIHRDDRSMVQNVLSRAFTAVGKGPGFRCRLRHADGSWRIFDFATVNLLDNPDVGGIVLNARDVTERAHAEDQLRAQEEQYRHVFEASGEGLAIFDSEDKLVEANPAFHRMHGYQPGDLLGEQATSWVHPEDRPGQVEFGCATRAGHSPSLERRDLRKDGSVFPSHVSGSVIDIGDKPHSLVVVRDDTERVRAFDLLAQRVAALSRVAASMTVSKAVPDAMRFIAEATVRATPALAASVHVLESGSAEPRMLAQLGLPGAQAEDIAGCWPVAMQSALHLGEPVTLLDAVDDALADPTMSQAHSALRAASWGVVTIVPFTSPQRHRGLLSAYYPRDGQPSIDDIAFMRAVSDQAAVAVENSRLLEEAHANAGIQERQRLARELHDSVSQALYGIALGAHTAQDMTDADSELHEPLGYILSLSEAGLTEMRSLIFELRPESLAIEGLVAALTKRVDVLRVRHHLIVEADLGVEPDVELTLKETLYRIAQEALHNTVKHARAHYAWLTLTDTDTALELEIRDDGTGFDQDAPRPGGLGLRSMRERVATHGGSIEIASRPGAGTVVRVQLPHRCA